MKEALRRAIAIRDGINRKTKYNDTNITDGVNRLSSESNIFLPQLQIIENENPCDVDWINNPNIPYFVPLNYIQSPSTASYIDTGFKATPKTRIVVDMQFTANVARTSFLMGSQYQNVAGNKNRLGFSWGWDYTSGTGKFIFNINDTVNYAWANTGIGNTNRHVWDMQSGSQKIDDIEYSNTTISPTLDSDLNIILFARNTDWTNPAISNYCPVRMFKCQIYDDNVLVRNYEPYGAFFYNNQVNNVNGLLDIENSVFYPSQGSEAFLGG